MPCPIFVLMSIFQSTPPARGATIAATSSPYKALISIHAPREGGDRHGNFAALDRLDFNPRPPRGGRLKH